MKNKVEYLKILNAGYSINIKSDYRNSEKMNTFIPTIKNIKLLEKTLKGITESENGAILLSGAYGVGKSFFVSLMLNMISNIELKGLDEYIEKVKNKNLIDSLKKVLPKKKYLIVFANDSNKNFEKSIIQGIYRAKEEEKLEFELDSEYVDIKNKIENWKSTNKELEGKYLTSLKKIGVEEEQLYNYLLNHDKKGIEIFSKIYSDIFFGEEYSKMSLVTPIEYILEDFERKVMETGDYAGIIYIFDEFGRYLESNIENIDVLQVQKMAEYCNSKNNSNLILISHKEIFQYTYKLNKKDDISEWEKVSGRFRQEHIYYEKTTVLDLIGGSLHKNEKYVDYRIKENNNFEKYSQYLMKSGFVTTDIEETIDKYYPLNYITAQILPDLSQKIAQNERTLFSFISSNENSSVLSILGEDFLIGLDRLYDYFQDNFRFLNADSSEYRTYMNSKILLTKVKKKEERLIIKSLAVIYIYNMFSEIEPTKEVLALSLNLSIEELEKITERLQEKEIIIYKRNFNHFKLVEENDVNVEKDIKKYIDEKLKNINYSEILNESLEDRVAYSLEYNELNDITRFLEKYYLDVSNISDLEKIPSSGGDGGLVYLLNLEKNPDYDLIVEGIIKRDLIIVTNKKAMKIEIKNILKELLAIKRLILSDEKYGTGILKNEILLYKTELVQILKKEIKKYFHRDNVIVYSKGDKLKNKFNLNESIRDYFNWKYPKFISFNYELINKNNISAPMKKVRSSILNKFLTKSEELFDSEKRAEYLNKTSAENTVARIFYGNVIEDLKEGYAELKEPYKEIEDKIYEYLLKEKYSVYDLYKHYASNTSEYGLRKGVFSIILGIILIKYRDETVIINKNNNLEENFSGELIDLIEKNPQNYIIKYQKFNEEESEYLNGLEGIFSEYYIEKTKNKSENIVNAIKSYIYSMPRLVSSLYLGETKLLSKIVQGIFSEKNATEFLFEELPKRLKTKKLSEVIESLKKDISKIKLDIKGLEELLNESIKKNLEGNELSLKEALTRWQKSSSMTENSVQLWLKNYKYKNDIQFLEDITGKIKGFDYKNWLEASDITDFISKFENEFTKKLKESTEGDKIVEIKFDNQSTRINFTEELSQFGIILKKKLETDLKNMGITVSDEEKKKILVELVLKI